MSKTILVVDDDPDMVELLRLALKEGGYASQTAKTGKEALLKAQRSPPDLVLLDVMLPDINGFTVCESLRHQPATASVPIASGTVEVFEQLVPAFYHSAFSSTPWPGASQTYSPS